MCADGYLLHQQNSVIFSLFAISFQVSFMALNRQIPGAPSIWIPTWLVVCRIIFYHHWRLAVINGRVGRVYLGGNIDCSYALIVAQIILVNLLIAMMGNSFNLVTDKGEMVSDTINENNNLPIGIIGMEICQM